MTVTASFAPATRIAAQRRPDDFNKSEVRLTPVLLPHISDIEELDDFFGDTDPSVIEPTPDIIAVREQRQSRVLRRQRCRDKAAMKPRNRMLRDVAEQNARSTDNGGGIKKPKLPKEYKRRIRNGEVPTDLNKFHLTRGWKLRIKENKARIRKAKQSKVALAIA